MDVLSQHGELPESVDSPESVELPEYVDALPNICGSEPLVQAAINGSRGSPVYLGATSLDISGIDAAFAIALAHRPAGHRDPVDAQASGLKQRQQLVDKHAQRIVECVPVPIPVTAVRSGERERRRPSPDGTRDELRIVPTVDVRPAVGGVTMQGQTHR